MKKNLLTLIISIAFNSIAIAQYTEIPLPFPDTTRFKVQFIDDMHGWVSSYRGSILQTTDGGKTWKENHFKSDTVFNDIEFIDKENGWIWVRDCPYFYSNCYKNKLYRTTNGGESWVIRPYPDSTAINRMNAGSSTNKFQYQPHCIYYLTIDRIIFEGIQMYVDSSGIATDYYGWYSTTNGGTSWNSIPTIRLPQYGNMLMVKDSLNWMEIYYQVPTDVPSITHCFLSSDAGYTWTETKAWFDVRTKVVWKTNKDKLILINNPKKNVGVYDNPAFITTDGGNTWDGSKYFGIAKMAIVPQDTTVWVIHDRDNNDGNIENGELRRVHKNGPQFPEEGKLMIPYLIRWITNVENKVYTLSADGRLFVFDDLLVSVNHPSPLFYKSFEIQSIYPNPFGGATHSSNPTTLITFSIPEDAHVRLSIIDHFGREVAVLVDEVKTAGTFSVMFNASNLASGIYTCRLISGEKSIAKNITLLK